MSSVRYVCSSFFFNDTATTEIYTLSLHDALPIYRKSWRQRPASDRRTLPEARHLQWRHAWSAHRCGCRSESRQPPSAPRSEEHTSELQSLRHLVCRLLLEKKNKKQKNTYNISMH